jgi:FAD/FMN-containing dehydrogenase
LNRRGLLRGVAAALCYSSTVLWPWPRAGSAQAATSKSRVRPGEAEWPSHASWEKLRQGVGGRLVEVRSPLAVCAEETSGQDCGPLFRQLKNPYFLRDEAGLTQTLGWVDAWTSAPSTYAIAAESTADVVAGVNFARENNLRLVIKGGGHSYQGTSSAPDSLLIWMRPMTGITVHDAFVGTGCVAQAQPRSAVTVEAGAIWGQVYDAVTTKAGRYVQGGGCLTVGVAGLVQSGGFGSFSKRYGTAAASLIEAEIVGADGEVRLANACTHPDLFWAIKGGGGGSFGAVTRMTLATHDLPDFFGGVFTTIRATSDAAFRRLIGKVMVFYRDRLFNPHWGEQIAFRPNNSLIVGMTFQGLDQQEAEALWRPFLDEIEASPQDFHIESAPVIVALPASRFWDPTFLKPLGDFVRTDDRPGAPASNIFWAGDQEQSGQVLHGYQSVWMPAALLQKDAEAKLADAIFAASRHWGVSLHFNKGLAGAPAPALAASGDTATNPAALNAFALLISGAEGPPAYPGIPGREADVVTARREAEAINHAVNEIKTRLGSTGSYLAESNFFEDAWQDAFWGNNAGRLDAVKAKYDPDNLFIVHHGVGSQRWSADGFRRLE